MKRFRILTATALIGAMVFGVTACGQPTPTTVTTEPTTTVTETETTPSESETTPSETTVETTKANPFTPDNYAEVEGASNFDWGSARLTVAEDNGFEYPDRPIYEAGQNITFSFKSSETYTLYAVAKFTEATGSTLMNDEIALKVANRLELEGVEGITDKCTLENSDGTYTMTIPSELVETGYYYLVTLTNATSGSTVMYHIAVRCA